MPIECLHAAQQLPVVPTVDQNLSEVLDALVEDGERTWEMHELEKNLNCIVSAQRGEKHSEANFFKGTLRR